jgi:hypothetical protein
MIEIVTLSSGVPPIGLRQHYFARDGMTGREIARLYATVAFPGMDVDDLVVSDRGRHLQGIALDEPLRATQVMMFPQPGFAAVLGFIASAILVPAAIAFAASYLWSLLSPPPEMPQERGDESSSTYSWQGIGTTYGSGFRIPIAYGLHDLGGQVIETSVEPLAQVSNTEVLASRLALCEGPVYSIGDIDRDSDYLGGIAAPDFNPNTTFPTNVRVNGNVLGSSVAQCFIRLGSTFQPPIPSFADVRNSVAVNVELEDEFARAIEQIPTGEANRCAVRIEFPQGLYTVHNGNYNRHRCEFDVDFRWNNGPWSTAERFVVAPPEPKRGSFSTWFEVDLPSPSPAPNAFDLRVVRITPNGSVVAPSDAGIVDYAIWRDVEYVIDRTLAYPRLAQLAVRLRATEKMQGGQPQWQVRGKWRKVRVWDQAAGWSDERYWAQPRAGDEVGDPYVGIWIFPPGRNPAWIAADLLTSDFGLGHAFRDADLDAAAFRDWADFCDQNEDGQALMCCDVVFDKGTSAWDALLRVFRAGRAVPVMSGNLIKPVYQFRDAHGRGTNTVPSRSRVSIVATSNLEEFEVIYMPTRSRPNILDVQILNEDLDYEQDLIPVEDPDAETNDPTHAVPDEVRRQTLEMYGVTRPRQARREALFQHALARLVRKRIRCVAGPDQLPVEIGDIIGVQHDAFRPFGDRDIYFSCRTARASAAVAEIVLDVDLEISAGARSVAVQAPQAAAGGGLPGFWLIDEPNGTYPAGTILATHAAVTVDVDAVVVVGEYDGDTMAPDEASAYGVEDYVVVGANLTGDMRRELQAVLWTPSAYDIDPGLLGFGAESASTDLGRSEYVPAATEISLVPAAAAGMTEIRWTMPRGKRGKRARVYAALPGRPLELIGEVVGDSMTAPVDPDDQLTIAVAVEDDEGTFDSPGLAATATLRAPEFRPVDQSRLSSVAALDTPTGVLLTWRPAVVEDLRYYEVRRGTVWTGAPILARVETPEVLLEHLPAGTHDLMVRVRFAGGLYSQRWDQVQVTRAVWPHESRLATATADLSLGLFTRTEHASGILQLQAGAYSGRWEPTSDLIDLGTPITADWRLVLGTHVVSGELCESDDGSLCGDPENMWQEVHGREPSRRLPGCWDFDQDGIAGDTELCAHDRTLCTGPEGTLGELSRAAVEVSWDGGGWDPFVPGRRRAQTLAVRLKLDRIDQDQLRVVTHLRAEAFA